MNRVLLIPLTLAITGLALATTCAAMNTAHLSECRAALRSAETLQHAFAEESEALDHFVTAPGADDPATSHGNVVLADAVYATGQAVITARNNYQNARAKCPK